MDLLDSSWTEKIEDHLWLYGDIGGEDGENNALVFQSAKSVYDIEIGREQSWSGDLVYYGYPIDRWTDVVETKIGLIYLSDFIYAHSGNDLATCQSGMGCDRGWMQSSNSGELNPERYEWTMTRFGVYNRRTAAWATMTYDPGLTSVRSDMMCARPTFYLLSGFSVARGQGTSLDPFIIAP